MKILMTMVAALAITSAVSAQQSECTFTTESETVTRTFDGFVRIVNIDGGAAVNVVNRRTGEVLDTVEFGGDRFGVRCSAVGRVQNTRPTATTPAPDAVSNDAPQTTNSRGRFSRITRSSSNTVPAATTPSTTSTSSGGGFPASAALGLPN